MKIKDIAEYEDTDSELAKYTISDLHHRINKATKELDSLSKLYKDNYTVSDKAKDIIEILKGESNE